MIGVRPEYKLHYFAVNGKWMACVNRRKENATPSARLKNKSPYNVTILSAPADCAS
jgi:hypothetical protein